MARHLFFAITIISMGVLNSPVKAVPDAAQCEDQAFKLRGQMCQPRWRGE
jgi:hypothetical protein